jgi:hypothetical protein
MADNLSIHVRNFNEKVRIMNQSQRKELVLSAQDARNLHADIFALLTHIAELSEQPQATVPAITQISMDGGGFR